MRILRVAGLALAAAIASLSGVGAPEPVARGEVLPAPPRIHIVHELVRIPVTPATRPGPVRSAGHSSVPASPRAVAEAAGRHERAATVRQTRRPGASSARAGLLARAGRALAGDGRHRPEPFPTPR
jgi:hypothetical protein